MKLPRIPLLAHGGLVRPVPGPLAQEPVRAAGEAYSAEDQALIESASAGHVLTAIHEALRMGEMETVVELLGILAAKDPQAADLIVKTIQYRES